MRLLNRWFGNHSEANEEAAYQSQPRWQRLWHEKARPIKLLVLFALPSAIGAIWVVFHPSDVFFTLCTVGCMVVLCLSTSCHQRHARNVPAQPRPLHAVGSPEYNAQVVAALQQLNERLATQGKRIPERTALEIIQDQEESEGNA